MTLRLRIWILSLADGSQSSYFEKVHRRTTLRSTRGTVLPSHAQTLSKPGARRYDRIRAAVAAAPTAITRPTPRIAAVASVPVTSLKSDLDALKKAQDKRNAPKWWSGFAAHPIRTAIAAVVILALSGVAAIAAPIAWNSYQAYQDIFVTSVPDQDNGFEVAVNAEGTVVIADPGSTEEAVAIPEWDGESRLTLLLLGVDRREGDYSRSDTIILVNIDPVEKTARMISIPRDLKVIVPGFGSQKINAAYAFGDSNENVPGRGPGLVMRTVEQNFGINIDYYAEIDFNGFIEIVDTVGGVTLNVPYPIRDNEYPGPQNQYMRIYFPSGWQHMDGETVLQYARTRHDDGDGRRSVRQQQVLLALRQQALTMELIGQAPTLISEIGDTVRTDISPDQVLKLARLAMDIDQSQIEQLSLDSAIWQGDPSVEFYFQADWAIVGEIMTDFTGEEIIPPMSALSNPRYDTTVRILDGTWNPGLGPRVLDVVQSNGFEDSSSSDLVDLGNYPQSIISTTPDNLATAYLLAGILGLPESSIRITDEVEPTQPLVEGTSVKDAESGTPLAEGTVEVQPLFPTAEGEENQEPAGEIVIILGDDLPDPAWYVAPDLGG